MSPLRNVQVPEPEPWLKPKDLAIIRRTNTEDIICVSWILRHITDPDAIDAALPLAGEIRWFDDGVDVNPPYDAIVSVFEACFDSTRKLYPGSRNRAYYSAQAVLWIHTLAVCKSEDFSRTFPLPDVRYMAPVRASTLTNFCLPLMGIRVAVVALDPFSVPSQVIHPYTRNGFQIYSCGIPVPA